MPVNNFRHIYQDNSIYNKQLYNVTAQRGVMPVPYLPKNACQNNFYVLKADVIPASCIIVGDDSNSLKDFTIAYIKRLGGQIKSDNEDFDIALTIQYLLQTSIIAVSSGTKCLTKFYTTNGNLAKTIVKFPQVVDSVLKDAKINPADVQKNTFNCIEIIPNKKADNFFEFDSAAAMFKLKKAEQTIIPLESLILIRERLIIQLSKKILAIKFFDPAQNRVENIETTLSTHTLLNLMSKEDYKYILDNLIDERKAMTLRLPDITNGQDRMVDVFIPTLIGYGGQQACLVVRDKFTAAKGKADVKK